MLKVQNLSKSFGGLMAVYSVDFHVEPGTITGIIGPNGAGKSTLFNLIAGSFSPSSGRVVFEERDISRMKSHQICRLGVSRTYQHSKPFWALNALQNVLIGLFFGRAHRHDEGAKMEAMEILRLLGLESRAETQADQLSPLDKKRLELARALATHPKLLLLDEIAAGLAPNETLQMMGMIRQIQERGITVLMIEHVMKAVMDLSDAVIVLHHGMKIAEGKPSEVSSDPVVIEAYLGREQQGRLG